MKIFELLNGKYDYFHNPGISVGNLYHIETIQKLRGVEMYAGRKYGRECNFFSLDAGMIEWEEYSIIPKAAWCTIWIKSKIYDYCKVTSDEDGGRGNYKGPVRIVLQFCVDDLDKGKLFIRPDDLKYGPKNFEFNCKDFFLMTKDSEYAYVNWESLPTRNDEGCWYFPEGMLTKGVR